MAEGPFRFLLEHRIGEPVSAQWQPWDRCAVDIHRRLPLQSYRIIQSASGASFLIFKPTATEPSATNCHGHTNRFLKSFADVAAGYGGILGIPICGTNPQRIILDTETVMMQDKLHQEPAALSSALNKLPLQPGDILVWVDSASGNLAHSTTLTERTSEGWMADDKMNDQPSRRARVIDIAQTLYRPAEPKQDEEEFHPERGPTNYIVQWRRPRSKTQEVQAK